MKKGHLSQYFVGVAAKRLSRVEVTPTASNQHEVNGVQPLKQILGEARSNFPARFVYLGEDESDYVTTDGIVTWYDSRENHPTRSEHRLYYPRTAVVEAAVADDLLVVGRLPGGSLLILVAKAGSTSENQIHWLFGLEQATRRGFDVSKIKDGRDPSLGYAAKVILEELGLELEPEDDYIDLLLEKFPDGFPTTAVFSNFARETLKEVAPRNDPDGALVAWMDREESLFRTLERHIVETRLKEGFGVDVDAFLAFSLSVQNRRKSRVGFALEHHIECILREHSVKHARGVTTEGKSRPDFLFPGQREYLDSSFPTARLRMLAVKSTCKERWRQVLAEANRIRTKHLLTLEPGISEAQTLEMQTKHLRLILPISLHETFSAKQRGWLMNVSDFIRDVKKTQIS